MNALWKFIRSEAKTQGYSIVWAAIISGIANAYLLSLFIRTADKIGGSAFPLTELLVFLLVFTTFVLSHRYAMIQAIARVEEALNRLRLRVSLKIEEAELRLLEQTEKTEIYSALTTNTAQLSQSAERMIDACQGVVVFVCCMVYILLLSPLAWLLISILIGIGIFSYLVIHRRMSHTLRDTVTVERQDFERLGQVLDGFKELKMNRNKREEFSAILQQTGTETEHTKIRCGIEMVTAQMFGRMFFYTMLALLVFLFPELEHVSREIVIRLIATVLFMMGPLSLTVTTIPTFLRANVVVEQVYRLEAILGQAKETRSAQQALQPISTFQEIRVEQLQFQYTSANDEVLFPLGPLDLTITRGEILFIVGGNGSGKSTLLKLLAGLYHPLSGQITVDGVNIQARDYRELFSVIFDDFYLFDRLYGMKTFDLERANALLKQMELDRKTRIEDRQFTNLKLSTGQRKRLAMLICVLEDKPIYLFDEWAADQDPHFRKYFYETLLPQFKAQGKTVIAVSHDDRYFHCADRVLKMEYGQCIKEEQA